MAQFLRPDGNITQTGTTNGFGAIDEVTAADGDFIFGADGGGNVYECSLSNPAESPGAGTTTVRYRLAEIDGGVLGDGSGNANPITIEVYEGTTQRASTTRSPAGAWTTYSWTPDLSAVSNWNDVRLRFSDTSHGGPPGKRRAMGISWAEIEVPDAATVATGTLNVTLGVLAAVGVAVLPIDAQATPNLAALTSSSAAIAPVEGISSATLDPLTSASSAKSDIDGSANATLAALTSTGAATVQDPQITGTANVTLAALTSTGIGEVDVEGITNSTLAPLTSISSGVSLINGATSTTLAPLTSSGAGASDIVATTTKQVGPVTVTAAGVSGSSSTGTLNITLGALTGAGLAEAPIVASGVNTLAALTSSSAGVSPIEGSIGVTLGPLTSAGLGKLSVNALTSSALGPVSSLATGKSDIAGIGNGNLAPLTLTASGSGPSNFVTPAQRIGVGSGYASKQATPVGGSKIAISSSRGDISARTAIASGEGS